jgi:hypothetical protein
MKLWPVVGAGLLLGACAGSPMRAAMTSPEERAKEEDAKCRDFGATPGTQAYFDCRMRLDERRAQMMADYRRDLASAPMPAPQPAPDLTAANPVTFQPYRSPPPVSFTQPAVCQPVNCITRPEYGQVRTVCQ